MEDKVTTFMWQGELMTITKRQELEMDFKLLKVWQLQLKCAKYGLTKIGRKQDLIARLVDHELKHGTSVTDPTPSDDEGIKATGVGSDPVPSHSVDPVVAPIPDPPTPHVEKAMQAGNDSKKPGPSPKTQTPEDLILKLRDNIAHYEKVVLRWNTEFFIKHNKQCSQDNVDKDEYITEIHRVLKHNKTALKQLTEMDDESPASVSDISSPIGDDHPVDTPITEPPLTNINQHTEIGPIPENASNDKMLDMLKNDYDKYTKVFDNWRVDFRGKTGKVHEKKDILADPKIKKLFHRLTQTTKALELAGVLPSADQVSTSQAIPIESLPAPSHSTSASPIVNLANTPVNISSVGSIGTESSTVTRNLQKRPHSPPAVAEQLVRQVAKTGASEMQPMVREVGGDMWGVESIDGWGAKLGKNNKFLPAEALMHWEKSWEPPQNATTCQELWQEMLQRCASGEGKILICNDTSKKPPAKYVFLAPVGKPFENDNFRTYKYYYICVLCKVAVDTRPHLAEHCSTHSDEVIKCKTCEEIFANPKTLAQHMKRRLICKPRLNPQPAKLKLKDLTVAEKMLRFDACFEKVKNVIEQKMIEEKLEVFDAARRIFGSPEGYKEFNKKKD